MLYQIKSEIEKLLRGAGVAGDIELAAPPKAELGDLAFACFGLAKEIKQSPADVAKSLVAKIQDSKFNIQIVDKVAAFGPYVNFYLNSKELAKAVLQEMDKEGIVYGSNNAGAGHKVMVEFAHPNTHKAFHVGHLRTLMTGESVARVLENSGYQVIRANYQGDVGLHIAKCLYGVTRLHDQVSHLGGLSDLADKIKFLGEAYAAGAKAYETDETAKEDIEEINRQIYRREPNIWQLYSTTRAWSLEYFDSIYKRFGTRFDRLYFESEVYERAIKIVQEFTQKGVFKASQGAIIFEGSKYGLHDRVFLTSQGNPPYEAKDLALAELQFKEFQPEAVYHVVAMEQTEYFKVLFKALEQTLPESKGKERHLVYGWVSIKGRKMSSRAGNVVLAEWLMDEVREQILAARKDSAGGQSDDASTEKIAIAAVKYAYLKTGISNDIAFDINEMVSLTGDSGPYLLYIGARIKSILKKSEIRNPKSEIDFEFDISAEEKQVLMHLANFPATASEAAGKTDPSIIARYLFSLAQKFNIFYEACPVLKAEGEVKEFRLALIRAVLLVMERGLELLGIEMVEEM